MSEAKDIERYLVPGLVRGIEILRLFNAERRAITAPEMARELGIPRTTVFRIAQTLEHLNLLSRDDGGTAYRLGAGLLGLGFEYIASLDVTEIGRAELEALRDATGCSVHMVVRDGVEAVVVMKVAGRSAFSGSLNVGTRLPAHATVLGRMLLADLDDMAIRRLYGDARLKRFSEQTPRTTADLIELLARDRACGYALSNAFFESGISSAAAPVYDHDGRVIAAINVTVPAGGDIGADVVNAVRASADRISRALHYRPAAAAVGL